MHSKPQSPGWPEVRFEEIPCLRSTALSSICWNPICGPQASFPCTLQERIKNNCSELQGDKSMIICDLCGEARDCLQKEIEGKEYDICSECWNPLAQKLKGKGRAISREIVLWPPPRAVEEQEDKERPGEPPKIWGAVQHHK